MYGRGRCGMVPPSENETDEGESHEVEVRNVASFCTSNDRLCGEPDLRTAVATRVLRRLASSLQQ